MTTQLSPNTQAILLLTAPLIAGKGSSTADLLSLSEYKRLAQHLREINKKPADLISADAPLVLKDCAHIVEEGRLQRLLGRGFLLSQVLERWQTRAIWVVSRADPEYPRRIKHHLREDAPTVLYGCGPQSLLETGGLAVVGSRHVDDELIDYTLSVGHLAARSGRTIVSGGARGVDQAAMRGALEAGGYACGVLADSLEKTTMSREQRNFLLDEHLALISPFDPSAGFNVGHAMQRNKLIYALADTSLVVSSDINKGGTWAGATEQLDKLKYVRVFVRSTGLHNAGLEALVAKGAQYWPNPESTEEFDQVLESNGPVPKASNSRPEEDPSSTNAPQDETSGDRAVQGESATGAPAHEATEAVEGVVDSSSTPTHPESAPTASPLPAPAASAGETLFVAVRALIQELLHEPMKEADVATALDVNSAQAKAWLQRLVDEGLVVKQKKPAGFVKKRGSDLFE